MRYKENTALKILHPQASAVVLILALVFSLESCKPSSSSSSQDATTYFQFGDRSHKDVFIFATDKPAIAQQARRILRGEEKNQTKVMGTIVKGEAAYKPGWLFHLEPNSVTFFQTSPELCDATSGYVSDHMDDVGKGLLPSGQWCPSTSQLIAEVSAPFPKAAVTDCFRYRPLGSGDKMDLRNTCNVCKVAVINYAYLN